MSADDHDDLAGRVLHLERKVADMDVTASEQRATLRREVQANTEMTQAVRVTACCVKKDTEEIVALLKGLKVFGRIAKWIVGAIAAVAALLGIGHNAKWW